MIWDYADPGMVWERNGSVGALKRCDSIDLTRIHKHRFCCMPGFSFDLYESNQILDEME